jgi:hypothetical protein
MLCPPFNSRFVPTGDTARYYKTPETDPSDCENRPRYFRDRRLMQTINHESDLIKTFERAEGLLRLPLLDTRHHSGASRHRCYIERP